MHIHRVNHNKSVSRGHLCDSTAFLYNIVNAAVLHSGHCDVPFDMYSYSHNKLLPNEKARVHANEDHLAPQHNKPGMDCLDDKQPSRTSRSKSLPTSHLDTLGSGEDDPSDERSPKNIPEQPPVRYAEISQTCRRYRKKVKPVEYQRPRYLSNASREETDSDIDQESTSLLTAPEWTAADRHTTNVQIETQL